MDFMYIYSGSFNYWILVIVTLIIGLISSGLVNSRIKKYNRVACSMGLTGKEAVQQMLSYYGINNVEVRQGRNGEDFFDPKTNSITLSPHNYNNSSIGAIATACHETGHACQYAFSYTPMKIRGAMFPVVSFASNAWIFLLMIGIFMHIAGFTTFAIILYALVVLYEIVTLPVEFNASNRALTYLKTIGLPAGEVKGAKSVLSACALTYVAAALTSVLQLLYLLGQNDD